MDICSSTTRWIRGSPLLSGAVGFDPDAMSANKNHQRRTDLKAGEF